MRARLVAPRNEHYAGRADPLESVDWISEAGDRRRITLRTDDEEPIPHERGAVHEVSGRDHLLFGSGRMRKHDVGLSALGILQRLAAAHSDHLDVEAKGLLGSGHESFEQSRVLGARRGDDGQRHGRLWWATSRDEDGGDDEHQHE